MNYHYLLSWVEEAEDPGNLSALPEVTDKQPHAALVTASRPQAIGMLCKVILRDSSGSSDCTSLYNDKKKLGQ